MVNQIRRRQNKKQDKAKDIINNLSKNELLDVEEINVLLVEEALLSNNSFFEFFKENALITGVYPVNKDFDILKAVFIKFNRELLDVLDINKILKNQERDYEFLRKKKYEINDINIIRVNIYNILPLILRLCYLECDNLEDHIFK